jgi:hypothetical protein
MITFVDPRSEPGAPVEPYELSIDVEAQPTTIGLVANGFPDSEEFLDQVEKALAVAVPTASFRRFNKHNASAMISDDMLDEVVADCQAVVGAYGH